MGASPGSAGWDGRVDQFRSALRGRNLERKAKGGMAVGKRKIREAKRSSLASSAAACTRDQKSRPYIIAPYEEERTQRNKYMETLLINKKSKASREKNQAG